MRSVDPSYEGCLDLSELRRLRHAHRLNVTARPNYFQRLLVQLGIIAADLLSMSTHRSAYLRAIDRCDPPLLTEMLPLRRGGLSSRPGH
jgi:hypothetical protein